MVFIALLLAVLLVYTAQCRIYSARIFSALRYRAYFEREEAEEGDVVYMYEEITNLGDIPIPNAKINTRLPEGLRFMITDKGEGEITLVGQVQSVFVLRGNAAIRRKSTKKTGDSHRRDRQYGCHRIN